MLGTSVLQAQATIAYSSTLLPAGQDISDYNVSCLLRVFDSYNAYSSLRTLVRVKKLVITPAALLSKGWCLIASLYWI